ncbi:hypothetical protein GQ457_01G013410 [Hibiscus cannabinus]
MNPLPITCLLHLLLLLVVIDVFSLIPKKVDVQIYNDLGSETDLIVHCKSKDDTLSEQHLGYHNYFEVQIPSEHLPEHLVLLQLPMEWNNTLVRHLRRIEG